MNTQAGPVRTWFHELARLLGSWAFSWALLSQLLGYCYPRQPVLDIQMHNTYFVVQPLLLTTLAMLPVATVVTGMRVLVGAFRHFGPNAVLVALASIWAATGLLATLLGLLR